MLHGLCEVGRVWSLTGTYVASVTDTAFLWFSNTGTYPLDFHSVTVSNSSAGLFALEYARTYTSGGAQRTTVGQMKTLSAESPTFNSYSGTLVLAGTGIDLVTMRVGADNAQDLLLGREAFQVFPGGTFAIRFKADTGTPTVAYTILFHGEEPWAVA